MYNGTLKVQWSSVPSYFINDSITPLLLIPHPIQFLSGMLLMRSWVLEIIWFDTFGYYLCVDTVDYCFCVGTVYYCFCVGAVDWCFCVCVDTDLVHSYVGMYCQNSCWQWDGFMSMSAVSRISNISSILGVNVRDSCWLCVWSSNRI